MLSLKSIEAKLKKFEDSSWQCAKEKIIESHKKWGKEDGASEQEIQQETTEAIAEMREDLEKTKESRYILYQIYFTLKVKYGRNLAKLAEELLPAVIKGNLEQRELEELRAAISSMLEQPTLPPPSGIRKLLEPIIRNYAEGETKERILQELEQRRVLAEQQAEEHKKQRVATEQQAEEERKQAEEERKQAEEERKQRKEIEQDILLLQRQLLELEKQLQAQTSQKITDQPSSQHHDAIQSSPVITTSFDMGTTSAKQPLLEENPAKEQEQCAPSAKKQCLPPSQDS